MMACIAPEVPEVLGVRRKIWQPGFNHAARALHKVCQARACYRGGRRFEYEAQSFLDQVLQLAASALACR